MAFTPAFNADLIAQLDTPFDPVASHALLVLLASGLGLLLLITVAGFRLYEVPLQILRFVRRESGAIVAGDPGPAYLYTSVPRALWPEMGRLGRFPRAPSG